MIRQQGMLQRGSLKLLLALTIVCSTWGLGNGQAFASQLAKNDAGAKPILGWSTWNFIGKNPTEANVEAQADAMHSSLQTYGFSYILLDDFWYLNPSTTVDQYGRWVVDTSRFPHGLSGVASYVHNLGLKFGAYLTPGIPVAAVNKNTPIEGTSYHAKDIVDTSKKEKNYNFGNSVMYYIDYSKPGAQAYINSWADELASWGVDFLKIDGVGSYDIPDVQAWSQGLQQSGRTIFFDLSNSLSISDASTWQTYANAWRTQGDIECYGSCSGQLVDWSHIAGRFSSTASWTTYAGPGGWNDLDAMDVADGSLDGITNTERQTYMTLFAIAKAPLYMGDDLTQMDSYGKQLLSNTEVIAVDQEGGSAGAPFSTSSNQQVWRVKNTDGSYAVALFNLGSSSAAVTVSWSQLGMGSSANVRDLWSHKALGTFSGSFSASVPAHGSRFLRITA